MEEQRLESESAPTEGRPSSPAATPSDTPPGMDPVGLASASRSCLAILVLLAVIALLVCVTTIIRIFF